MTCLKVTWAMDSLRYPMRVTCNPQLTQYFVSFTYLSKMLKIYKFLLNTKELKNKMLKKSEAL
jgi:hypothetical protein